MRKSIYTEPTIMATACIVVGFLAALGKFNSISNFPVIFALICLSLGLLNVWRRRSQGAAPVRVMILLVGCAVALGGWVFQQRAIDERRADRRDRRCVLPDQAFAGIQGGQH